MPEMRQNDTMFGPYVTNGRKKTKPLTEILKPKD